MSWVNFEQVKIYTHNYFISALERTKEQNMKITSQSKALTRAYMINMLKDSIHRGENVFAPEGEDIWICYINSVLDQKWEKLLDG